MEMSTISAAFVKARKAFAPAIKNATNPHYKSKYADLAACIEAVDDAFLENGLAFYHEIFPDDSGVTVETVLLHESGELMRFGKLHVPASKQDAQAYGSALSYARRYSLMAACGIAPEDDDGNAASRTPASRQQPAKSNGTPQKKDEKPKRTWKDAVGEIVDAKSAEATATKLHEHFAGHADPHDTIMRNVLAKIGQLVGEKKIDEAQGDAMSAIIREWIITPTEYETLNKEAAGVF